MSPNFPFRAELWSNHRRQQLDGEIDDFHSTKDGESWRYIQEDKTAKEVTATCQESHGASYHGDLSLQGVLDITIDPVEGSGVEVDLGQLQGLVVFGPG